MNFKLNLKKHEYSGSLVAVCGTDGAGKTTFIQNISEYLESNGQEVLLTRQPSNDARKHPLFHEYLYFPDKREKMDYQALLALMLFDRLQHISDVILPAIEAGKFVITDRYIYTLIANMHARGYDEKWVYDACKHILRPDYTFVLHASTDVIVNRILQRKSFEGSYVERDLLIKSQENYLHLAKANSSIVINTSSSSEKVMLEMAANLFQEAFNGDKKR